MKMPCRWRQAMAVVSILLMCVAAPADSQVLWKDSVVGMSQEAVQRQFPQAARPSKPGDLADGSRELLSLSNTLVQGHAFDAAFFFKQGKLTQVNLQLQEQGGQVFALQTFRGIKAAFDAKYGAPDDEEDHQIDAPTGLAIFRYASWRSGRTLITLAYATAAGRLVVFNVAYRLASAKKTDDI